MKVGIQLYSLSPVVDAGRLEEAVAMACASGVDGVELYSNYDVPAIRYRERMNEAGVVCSGTHNHWAPLRDDLDHVMEYNYALGNKNIICHWLNKEDRGSADNYRKVAESLNGIAARLKRNGFDLLYHNHDFEFREVFEGRSGYDILVEELDPQLVKFELHIGQLPQFGIDIEDFMKKLGRRVGILHVHVFNDGAPFDSAPAVKLGKELDVSWAVLENVYPAGSTVEQVRADVDALRAMTRAERRSTHV